MISFSATYFCVLLFSGSLLHVFADKDSKDCCCEDKKTANVFSFPVIKIEDLTRPFNYTNGSVNVFRKISNDSDITHTAEILDKGFYTALCWSEIITLIENRNGSNAVKREYAITFETKSDIPKRYLKVDDQDIEPEYKEYEIYDQATKKSQIVNFTTISKSDESVVRESRKMFCGSGPIFTRELISWSQTDRKRVEFKVSPKKQNLIANDVHTSTTPPPSEPYQNDSSTKPFPYESYSASTPATVASTVPQSKETPRSNFSDFPDSSVIHLPEFVVATGGMQDHLKPYNDSFSPSTHGKVPSVNLNPKYIDGELQYNQDKYPDADNKNTAKPLSTSLIDEPSSSTPPSSTVSTVRPYSERSSNIFATTPAMTEYSETVDNSGSTKPDINDSDTSDELDESGKMDWKTTDCDTTYSADKETPVYSTRSPDVQTETKPISTMPISKDVIGFDTGANRIGSDDDYGFFDNDKPGGIRNSTMIELLRPPQYPHLDLGKMCDIPRQKIIVKVRITLNDILESTEPNNVYSTNFPIMAIEKEMMIPIDRINKVPRVPDWVVNLEWERFMRDLGFHFFAMHEEYMLNYTQLVSEILNSSPISEFDLQILPEETVRRLQSISNYLKICEVLNGRQATHIKPEYRFGGKFGEQESMTNFNDPNYGFYNYLLSPQYTSSNNYRQQTDSRVPYIKESAQPTLSQLIKFVDMQRFPNAMHPWQGYSSLQNPFNTDNSWKGPKSHLYSPTNSKFHSRIQKASGEVCPNCK